MEGIRKTVFGGAVSRKETLQGEPLMILMDGPRS